MTERVIDEGTAPYRRTPSTQNGNSQDMSAKHVQETIDSMGLEPNIGGPDQTPPGTPVEDGSSNGAPNSGQQQDGWHPAQ